MQQLAFRCNCKSSTFRDVAVVSAKSIGSCCFIIDTSITFMTKAMIPTN
jgi:hypothetical protein